MKVVIAGAGEVGFNLAKLLSYESQEITLIDTKRENLAYADNHLDIKVIKGDATSIANLKEAKVNNSDLVIAHSLRKAGTHLLKPHAFGRKNIFPAYKLTAKIFSDILSNELQIPCSKSDIDNARKIKSFTPHQVPRTQQSEMLFRRIEQELFPNIELEQFLSNRASFTLEVDPLE